MPLIHDNGSRILFLCAHATLIKINRVLNHHKNLNKSQEETTQDSLSHPPSPTNTPLKNIRSRNQTPTLGNVKDLFNQVSGQSGHRNYSYAQLKNRKQ